MKLYIPYHKLEIIPYEGAGNKTPVLDVSKVVGISDYTPYEIREFLENDMRFRKWLQKKGRALHADSVMIYYSAVQSAYDYVTFIGEPNALLTSAFSVMCGNGIRSLALHIFLHQNDRVEREKYLETGIAIWAGGVKIVRIISIDETSQSAYVRVEMGPFVSSKASLNRYTNGQFKNTQTFDSLFLPSECTPEYLLRTNVGIGYNGDEDGEPHLVILTRWDEYLLLLSQIGEGRIPSSYQEIIHSLRSVVCAIGGELTFSKELFPLGINVNLGLVLYDEIFMSTHERNLSLGQDECLTYHARNQFCICNTMACGTGGAAVVNIAKRQGFIDGTSITTHHPGGQIEYHLDGSETLMIGPAHRITKENRTVSQRGWVHAQK